jgi:hypothetical protein
MTATMELIKQADSCATPRTLNSELLTPEEVAIRRKFCNWLWLWRRCTQPACRRAHRCAGDPTPCFAQFWSDSPELTRIWAFSGMPVLADGGGTREATHMADMALLGMARIRARLPLDWDNWHKYPVKPVDDTHSRRRARKDA